MKKKKTVSKKNEEILKKLAQKLALNYFNVSLAQKPQKPKKGKDANQIRQNERNAICEIFNDAQLKLNGDEDAKERLKWSRNIVIVGAGASFSIYDKIPLAADVIDMLKEDLGLNFKKKEGPLLKYLESKYKKRLKMLNNYGIEQDKANEDFETTLALLSHFFTTKDIRALLKKYFDHRFFPHLPYEILAHMFKHRFIDVIINFNFDEILDQAIEEEMGIGNYHYIFSDGHCKSIEEVIIDERLREPIYLKPHGTISHKSSLKFTKEHYFELPFDLRNFLEKVITGKINDSSKKEIKKINIITVGYGMQSLDINRILDENDKEGKFNFYHFNPENPVENQTKGSAEEAKIFPKWRKMSNHKLINEDIEYNFSKLWTLISNCFNDSYKPRNINRHEIVYDLFKDDAQKLLENKVKLHSLKNETEKEKEEYEKLNSEFLNDEANYFKNRTYLELLLSIAKSKGEIEVKKLLVEERLGIYYSEYIKQMAKLEEVPLTMEKMCQKIGLSNSGDISGNLWKLKECKDAFKDRSNGNKIMDKLLTTFWIKSEKVLPIKSNYIKDLSKIYQKDTVDVNSRFNNKMFYIFPKFSKKNILVTNLSLRYKFLEMFNRENIDNWNTLLVVSERGKMFTKDNLGKENFGSEIKEKLGEKKVCLILADDIYLDDIKTTLKGVHKKNNIFIRKLPFWNHYHHLVIFANNLKNDIKVMRGIYYGRGGLSNKINPIFFDGKNDSLKNSSSNEVLLNKFYSCYLKSKFYCPYNLIEDRALEKNKNEHFKYIYDIKKKGEVDKEGERIKNWEMLSSIEIEKRR